MDIFFQDPSEVPLPPDEVRIIEVRAAPSADGRKVTIYLEVTPFQKRPNADILVMNGEGDVVADASIIESMTRKMEVTLHLRPPQPGGEFTVSTTVFYTDPISMPQEGETEPPKLPEAHPVDRSEIRFQIPVESS